jgi:hypothetical protein
MIPPPAQRAMAARAGATFVDVKGSHALYISQPAAVASTIHRPPAPAETVARLRAGASHSTSHQPSLGPPYGALSERWRPWPNAEFAEE